MEGLAGSPEEGSEGSQEGSPEGSPEESLRKSAKSLERSLEDRLNEIKNYLKSSEIKKISQKLGLKVKQEQGIILVDTASENERIKPSKTPELPVYGIIEVFPELEAIVMGKIPHGLLAFKMIEVIQESRKRNGLAEYGEKEEDGILNLGVSCVQFQQEGENTVLVRMDYLDRGFLADNQLQRLIPKKQIKFSHLKDKKVRDALKKRGECWRFNPQPHSDEEIKTFVENCRTEIRTGIPVYYNRETGERFLTYEDFFSRTKDCQDLGLLTKRIGEVLHLLKSYNKRGMKELRFLTDNEDDSVDISTLEKILELGNGWSAQKRMINLIKYILRPYFHQQVRKKIRNLTEKNYLVNWIKKRRTTRVNKLIERFKDELETKVGFVLRNVDYENKFCVETVYERLRELIPAEEEDLKISPEFFLHIKWLPGRDEEAENFDNREQKEIVGGITREYRKRIGKLEYFNLGEVIEPRSERKGDSGMRGVYVVNIKQESLKQERNQKDWIKSEVEATKEEIRVLRRKKWGIEYHLQQGKSWEEAKWLSDEYTSYVQKRLEAIKLLGILRPRFSLITIEVKSEIRGKKKKIPRDYVDRQYVQGVASNKIPKEYFANPDFVKDLSYQLGKAAAANMILGRRHHETGEILFDDGDEIVQFWNENDEKKRKIRRIVMADTTISFEDYERPITTQSRAYAEHLVRIIDKAFLKKINDEDLRTISQYYYQGIREEFNRLKTRYKSRKDFLKHRFNNHREKGGFGYRWKKVLERLEVTYVEGVIEAIKEEMINVARKDPNGDYYLREGIIAA